MAQAELFLLLLELVEDKATTSEVAEEVRVHLLCHCPEASRAAKHLLEVQEAEVKVLREGEEAELKVLEDLEQANQEPVFGSRNHHHQTTPAVLWVESAHAPEARVNVYSLLFFV